MFLSSAKGKWHRPGFLEREKGEREGGSWSLKGSDQDLKADNVGSCPGSCLYHPTDSFMKSCYLILRKSWGVYYGVESESDNGGDGDIDGGGDVPTWMGESVGRTILFCIKAMVTWKPTRLWIWGGWQIENALRRLIYIMPGHVALGGNNHEHSLEKQDVQGYNNKLFIAFLSGGKY